MLLPSRKAPCLPLHPCLAPTLLSSLTIYESPTNPSRPISSLPSEIWFYNLQAFLSLSLDLKHSFVTLGLQDTGTFNTRGPFPASKRKKNMVQGYWNSLLPLTFGKVEFLPTSDSLHRTVLALSSHAIHTKMRANYISCFQYCKRVKSKLFHLAFLKQPHMP